MISCSEAVRRLWEYLDHELSAADEAQVEDHLALCRRCCGEAEFTAELCALLRSTGAAPPPADVERSLLGLLEGLEREAP